MVCLALASAGIAVAEPSGQLPADVVPRHYELLISPDAKALAFTGRVTIDVQARTQARTITLNEKGLTFDSVRSTDGRQSL
jgi:aminopeptidase N